MIYFGQVTKAEGGELCGGKGTEAVIPPFLTEFHHPIPQEETIRSGL